MIYWSIQLLRVESNNSKINKYSKGQQRYEQGRDIEKAILNKYCVLRLCKLQEILKYVIYSRESPETATITKLL